MRQASSGSKLILNVYTIADGSGEVIGEPFQLVVGGKGNHGSLLTHCRQHCEKKGIQGQIVEIQDGFKRPIPHSIKHLDEQLNSNSSVFMVLGKKSDWKNPWGAGGDEQPTDAVLST